MHSLLDFVMYPQKGDMVHGDKLILVNKNARGRIHGPRV